ncbi:MAG TPA: hypothetical protein VF756_06880 [Thermoanaerobaculia bacterium]
MIDPEWRSLMEDWQAGGPEATPAPLPENEIRRIRRKVRRRSFGLILLAAGEILAALGTVAFLFHDLPHRHRPVDLVGFVGTVILFIVAFVFSYWNRRGVWWPAAESTRTFVELSAERCRRRRRTLRFCPWLLAAELAFLIPWAVWALLSRTEPAPLETWLAAFGWMALASLALLGGGAWYKRRTVRELAEWEELLRGLRE